MVVLFFPDAECYDFVFDVLGVVVSVLVVRGGGVVVSVVSAPSASAASSSSSGSVLRVVGVALHVFLVVPSFLVFPLVFLP